ncbi:hypothetical protein EPUL_006396, partial [Erysiphe pulchra]
PECAGPALDWWEQSYLKELVWPQANSNFSRFSEKDSGLKYRDINDSVWRCHGQSSWKPENHDLDIPLAINVPNISYEEFTGTSYLESSKPKHRSMSVILGVKKEVNREEGLHTSGKKVRFEDEEKKITLESFLNQGDMRKRARPIYIEDLLNKEEIDPKLRKRDQKRSERKVIRHLREIVGRQGKGPINYQKLAEDIKVEVSLMDLFQMSPDLSKAFRSLSTRINRRLEKRRDFSGGKKKLFTEKVNFEGSNVNYDSESLLGQATNPIGSTDQKAFRVPVTVRSKKDGRIVNVTLPTGIAQADQGSDMIIVTVGFLKKLGLSANRLSEKGFEGLTMNVADGTSAELTHYSEFEIGVLGVWRKIEAFVRPFTTSNIDEVHLLLGLPWLHAVDAKIKIRESIIEIGDIQKGENVVNIEGPQFVESESHKLVLCPKNKRKTQPLDYQETSSEESEDSPYDSGDESDESISDEEIEILKDGPEQVVKRHLGERMLMEKNELSVVVEEKIVHNKCCAAESVAPKRGGNGEAEVYSNGYVPKYPTKRRPVIRKISEDPQTEIDDWFSGTGVKIGELSVSERDKVTRLLYTYKDLNSTDLENLPYTDLYVHRVRLKEGTLPFSRPKQRRWPPGKEFWMKRIITDGLRCGLYESTVKANGCLSNWNAMAQLVDKSDEPDEWDEPRLTFNYRNVVEEKPGCFVELMSRCHDYLGHPDHKMFCKMDLKNGYWAILVHPEDRHYFAFSMPGMGQLQPTRMPQGSCSASFSFTELMYLVLGQIPATDEFSGMDSILVPKAIDQLPGASFYIDDIFSGFETFEQGYELLKNELLPRLSWARLRLSFKKLELFVTSTVALGVNHKAGGKSVTKTERCDKIRDFPVPKDKTGVRKFLGAIGITRNWVKNFAELKRPLTKLTGNTEFSWGASEQASFQLLKEKCSKVVEMHGWDFMKPVRMYSDASLYGAGCAITQERVQDDGKVVEVPIAYDAFTFSKSQLNYGIYKKELCAIVEFSRNYEHMLKSTGKSVILTDHKPLTYFLKSSSLDGIYARWASELRCLGVEIEWIPGERNEVADALSRTIFPGSDCGTPPLEEFGELVVIENQDPLWIWKDGKGGYEELLEKVAGPLNERELEKLFSNRLETNEQSFGKQKNSISSNLGEVSMGKPLRKYAVSEWYQDIVKYLIAGTFPESCITKVQKAALIRKSASYYITSTGELIYCLRGVEKKCIVKEEVSQILQLAHDQGGHFSQVITQRKLRMVFWPRMAVDVRDYVKGCLTCAKFGTAIRSQTSARVVVSEPMELLGIDFIGPFPSFSGVRKKWILIAVDYFSRYIWTEAVERSDSDTVINFLKNAIFDKFGLPIGLYMDPGPHFGEKTRNFAESCGTLWNNSPVAAKRAVGMIEKSVDILQRVLKKMTLDQKLWPERLSKATLE